MGHFFSREKKIPVQFPVKSWSNFLLFMDNWFNLKDKLLIVSKKWKLWVTDFWLEKKYDKNLEKCQDSNFQSQMKC